MILTAVSCKKFIFKEALLIKREYYGALKKHYYFKESKCKQQGAIFRTVDCKQAIMLFLEPWIVNKL